MQLSPTAWWRDPQRPHRQRDNRIFLQFSFNYHSNRCLHGTNGLFFHFSLFFKGPPLPTVGDPAAGRPNSSTPPLFRKAACTSWKEPRSGGTPGNPEAGMFSQGDSSKSPFIFPPALPPHHSGKHSGESVWTVSAWFIQVFFSSVLIPEKVFYFSLYSFLLYL